MPELPEVKTVCKILNTEIINEKIKSIEILYKNIIKEDLDYFKKTLQNQTILSITTMGKFLIFHLSNNIILLSHLRMEGKYSYLNINESNPNHSCVIFNFYSNKKLIYHDSRKFGIMLLKNENNYLNTPPISLLGKQANELKKIEINNIYLKKISKSNKYIKELITNQNIISGIGNIYADEILYASKINPFTKGKNITLSQFENICNNSKKILNKAIELGGSTIKSYHPKEGIDGKFQNNLKCYGKTGQNCPICNSKFKKLFLNNRGTTFCPNCQINYDIKKAVGITGFIGSGKTTLLEIIKELKYKTISCDEITKELYKNQIIKNKVNKLFNYKVINQEDKNLNLKMIKELIINNEDLHEKLEDLMFPYIEDVLINEIKNTKNLLFIEVPLLFKAHLEYLFEHIIYLESNKNIILNRLKQRGSLNPKLDLYLYKRNNEINIKELEKKYNITIIENNYENKEDLKKIILSFICSWNRTF